MMVSVNQCWYDIRPYDEHTMIIRLMICRLFDWDGYIKMQLLCWDVNNNKSMSN